MPSVAYCQAFLSADATEWFRHADDLTNIRLPGGAPFHMKVAFHSFPGLDFEKKGRSAVLAGDGTYDEVWLSPERWRREITLAGFHAEETRADGVRKYQASSSYEPARVLMLLDALYNPVPRDLLSPEIIDPHQRWKIEHLTAGQLSYVRISSSNQINAEVAVRSEYDFLNDGILVRSADGGLATAWQDAVVFSRHLVPRHLTIQASGRDLLTADVTIGPSGQTDPSLFEQAGAPASPGTTLRPFHWYEVKRGHITGQPTGFTDDVFLGVIRGVVDRDGVPRELEVVSGDNDAGARQELKSLQAMAFSPPTADGTPCEMELVFIVRQK